MTRKQIANIIFSMLALFGLTLSFSGQLSAQSTGQPKQPWAVKMFSEMGTSRTHDFGSVALHAEVVHHFVFKNIYREEVEIASAQSNCGCTQVTVSRHVIPSGETGEIIAKVDTSGKEHTKRRKATITVIFRRPAVAEVQLQVQTYIRSDIGFEPGTVDFGTVPQGRVLSKKVYLQYEGVPGWGLTSIRKTSNTIKAEAREVRRQGGHVLYEIDVSLVDSAPAGYLNGLLRFTTNETNSSTASIFLPIHGLIMEPLTAKPSCFQLGVIRPGEKITKNLVVRGAKPFRVVNISSPDSRIKFLVANDQSPVHVIPVTFTAGFETGKIDQVISIKTDQQGLPGLEVDVSGFIFKGPSDSEAKPLAVQNAAVQSEKPTKENPNGSKSVSPQTETSPGDAIPESSGNAKRLRLLTLGNATAGDSETQVVKRMETPSSRSIAEVKGEKTQESSSTNPLPVLSMPIRNAEKSETVRGKNEQNKAEEGWTTVVGHEQRQKTIATDGSSKRLAKSKLGDAPSPMPGSVSELRFRAPDKLPDVARDTKEPLR